MIDAEAGEEESSYYVGIGSVEATCWPGGGDSSNTVTSDGIFLEGPTIIGTRGVL